jgi:multisite-specific tRNA:(cytosine-C5)-methyltransferase
MGGNNKNKRHAQGTNRSADKKRRRENEATWKSTRGDAPRTDNRDSTWNQALVTNDRFVAFYKSQGFVEDVEWPDFMKALGSTLPACFRINPDYAFSAELRKQLLSFVGEKIVIDGVEIDAVEQMAWYSNAYKLGTDRKSIRKLPALSGLHKWMMLHTDCGNITRQEAVSMVPPLALNVLPHHKCLDMCAAPGSKTSQLLEIVNRSLSGPEEEQGLVVANDSDTDRAYMLVHQCRRINSPLLIVTTHKGQMFPKLSEGGDKKNKVSLGILVIGLRVGIRVRVGIKLRFGVFLRVEVRFILCAYEDLIVLLHQDGYFDRVLCDVPCSYPNHYLYHLL